MDGLNVFVCVCLVPDEAPVILNVKPSTTTSVIVQWQVNILKQWVTTTDCFHKQKKEHTHPKLLNSSRTIIIISISLLSMYFFTDLVATVCIMELHLCKTLSKQGILEGSIRLEQSSGQELTKFWNRALARVGVTRTFPVFPFNWRFRGSNCPTPFNSRLVCKVFSWPSQC